MLIVSKLIIIIYIFFILVSLFYYRLTCILYIFYILCSTQIPSKNNFIKIRMLLLWPDYHHYHYGIDYQSGEMKKLNLLYLLLFHCTITVKKRKESHSKNVKYTFSNYNLFYFILYYKKYISSKLFKSSHCFKSWLQLSK